MMFVQCVWSNATRDTMHLPPFHECELHVTIEPEALNRAIDTARGSMPVPVGVGSCGGGGGILNPHPTTTEHSGSMARQTVKLFADSASEKLAWVCALEATANGKRQWAHARHEASITMNAARDSVERLRSPRG
jgi:hypothetical protein